MKKLAVVLTIFFGIALSGIARANFIYSLNGDFGGNGLPDFVLSVPTLIAADTTFDLSDFDSISLDPAQGAVISVSFAAPLSNPEIRFNRGPGDYYGFFWISSNAFVAPGTYCAGFGDCGNTAAILTITEVASVPLPATLFLLGIGLVALGGLRRISRG